MPRALRGFSRLPRLAVILLMLIAMIDMLLGVFLRYVWTWLSASFDLPRIDFFWVEEIGESSLIWLTFIGAAIGIRRGTHFSVHLVTDRFPQTARRVIFAVHYLLIAAFGVVMAVYGWQVSELNSQSFSPALNMNLRWLYFSSVVGGVLICACSLATLVDAWHGRTPGLGASTDG
jgi:TRAP-type C4-dicarboxylate transport system permease small subunit